MTKLYLIRHGQSVANLEGVFAGHYNAELTELGKKQAERIPEFFSSRGIVVDAVAASDLLRAYDTALPVAGRFGLSVEAREDLREIFAGAWEGVSFSDIREQYTEDFALWVEDAGRARCTEGESAPELAARVLSALTDIAKANEGKTVVIATHATPIRALTTLWLYGDVAAMKEVPWVPNASVTEVTFEDGVFTLGEVGAAEHLGDLVTSLPANV